MVNGVSKIPLPAMKQFLVRAWRVVRPALPALALLGLCTVGFCDDVTLPSDVTAAITDIQGSGEALIKAILPAVKTLLKTMFGIVAVWFCYKQLRRVVK